MIPWRAGPPAAPSGRHDESAVSRRLHCPGVSPWVIFTGSPPGLPAPVDAQGMSPGPWCRGPQTKKEVGVSSRENPSSPYLTYRMEVSPTGQGSTPIVPNMNDPVALLQLVVNIQSQTLDLQRQSLDLQRQQLDLAREAAQINREQRARQIAELERWQNSHESVIEHCRESLTSLEQVHASLMGELANYVSENHENLLDGDFALTDFVDRFGPRLAHLNTMLAVLRPLAAAIRKPENSGS